MFTPEEIIELQKISASNPLVLRLFNYWNEAQEDGFVAARVAINKKWLDLASDLDDTVIQIKGDDKVYESFLKTTKLFEDISKTESKKKETDNRGKGKKGQSFTDDFANSK